MRLVNAARDVVLAAGVVSAAYGLLYASTSFGATQPRPPPHAISAVALPAQRALSPGHSVPVRVTLRNDTEHPVDLDAVTIEGKVSHLPRGCSPSWFTFAVRLGSVGVLAGNGGRATVTGRLNFVETHTNQSACAGATLALLLRPLVP